MPLRHSLLDSRTKSFGAKLRDVFTMVFARASHQPAALCVLLPRLLVPFKAFLF